jgi:hypothetical protein
MARAPCRHSNYIHAYKVEKEAELTYFGPNDELIL